MKTPISIPAQHVKAASRRWAFFGHALALSLRPSSLALGAAVFFAVVASSQGAAAHWPHAWERWEQTLTSTRNYDNPYADVTLRVRYSGPEGRVLATYGFWDGGDVFRIRCAFPIAGTWRWETECSDAGNSGLHGRRGTVEVTPYRGENTLYRRGFLKVSDDRRYLTFGDGTPFLWMGDTAWAAPMRSNEDEWNRYLADRRAKRFPLIQVAPAPKWAGETNRDGVVPFHDEACFQGNPAFWQAFERKIQQANEAGFVVMLIGLMEPVNRYPESAAACLFSRQIVARLFGNFVIFSPSFDSNFMPLADEVGRATRDATTVHLITQHPGTPSREPIPTYTMKYYDQPYLDFAGVQSGHNQGNRERCAHHASEWMLHAYRHEPHKPVINLEAMYDGQGEKAWQAVDARSHAWLSWLSGAKGYTYGAGDVSPKVTLGNGGIWKWITDPEKYDYWEKALQWESASQMQYLHDFLAALEWWRLEPAPELIRNQPEAWARRAVLAKIAGRDRAVAYLPDNEAIEVDVSTFSVPLAVRWFDPVRGRYAPARCSVETPGVHRLVPPSKGEWVLTLGGPSPSSSSP
ncbi:MAG: DUF4038 domain-containing protein [Verrucomicrobia bacterium]|nr:DUF4038 domain-containing protein [Verrucomicrobiota bacterium]